MCFCIGLCLGVPGGCVWLCFGQNWIVHVIDSRPSYVRSFVFLPWKSKQCEWQVPPSDSVTGSSSEVLLRPSNDFSKSAASSASTNFERCLYVTLKFKYNILPPLDLFFSVPVHSSTLSHGVHSTDTSNFRTPKRPCQCSRGPGWWFDKSSRTRSPQRLEFMSSKLNWLFCGFMNFSLLSLLLCSSLNSVWTPVYACLWILLQNLWCDQAASCLQTGDPGAWCRTLAPAVFQREMCRDNTSCSAISGGQAKGQHMEWTAAVLVGFQVEAGSSLESSTGDACLDSKTQGPSQFNCLESFWDMVCRSKTAETSLFFAYILDSGHYLLQKFVKTLKKQPVYEILVCLNIV